MTRAKQINPKISIKSRIELFMPDERKKSIL